MYVHQLAYNFAKSLQSWVS